MAFTLSFPQGASAQTMPEFLRPSSSAERQLLTERIREEAEGRQVAEAAIIRIAQAIEIELPGRNYDAFVALLVQRLDQFEALLAENERLKAEREVIPEISELFSDYQALDTALMLAQAGEFEQALELLARKQHEIEMRNEFRQSPWRSIVRTRHALAELTSDYERAFQVNVEAAELLDLRMRSERAGLYFDAAMVRWREGRSTNRLPPLVAALDIFESNVLPLLDPAQDEQRWPWFAAMANSATICSEASRMSATADLTTRCRELAQNALDALDREEAPEIWINQLLSVAQIYSLQARQTNSLESYQTALSLIDQCLQEISSRGLNQDFYYMLLSERANVIQEIGILTGDESYIREAISAQDQVASYYLSHEDWDKWMMVTINRGNSIYNLYYDYDNIPLYVEGINNLKAVVEALELVEASTSLMILASGTLASLQQVYGVLAEDGASLRDSVTTYSSSLDLLDPETAPYDWHRITLNRAQSMLAYWSLTGEVDADDPVMTEAMISTLFVQENSIVELHDLAMTTYLEYRLFVCLHDSGQPIPRNRQPRGEDGQAGYLYFRFEDMTAESCSLFLPDDYLEIRESEASSPA
ncbi:hypothetical protein OZN62_06780 [Aurantiacibacter sp. MUD11]|uniref:hypothetical protein n=1 Tax=Aurantiacibacter sp. MUD11 TaxID=3003265 RepID=UPI0022AA678E|nr:hypothetical protein [Aurantiacibacter sp. MUD11]WAT19263.1 hypothetical protein OZN62_06780 [Aurantiacibacter sp. MUD11]